MNYRKIGNDFVNKCIEQALEPNGWKCQKAGKLVSYFKKDGRFIALTRQEDLFGAFDVVAVHPQKPFTLWIQMTVGGSSAASTRRKKIEAAAPAFNEASGRLLLWTRQGDDKQRVRQEMFNGSWSERAGFTFRDPASITDAVGVL